MKVEYDRLDSARRSIKRALSVLLPPQPTATPRPFPLFRGSTAILSGCPQSACQLQGRPKSAPHLVTRCMTHVKSTANCGGGEVRRGNAQSGQCSDPAGGRAGPLCRPKRARTSTPHPRRRRAPIQETRGAQGPGRAFPFARKDGSQ